MRCSLCDSPILARGWCRAHYLRWYRYGNPMGKSDFIQPAGNKAFAYKHGYHNHPLYKTWSNMLARCENPNEPSYSRYGAQGITVCDEWHDIKVFIADMGERPKGFTLDRIDNSKGYSPDNCRWATLTTQSRNRGFVKLTMEKAVAIRGEHRKGKNGRGEGVTRQQIAEKYHVSLATIKKVLSGTYWKEIAPQIEGILK